MSGLTVTNTSELDNVLNCTGHYLFSYVGLNKQLNWTQSKQCTAFCLAPISASLSFVSKCLCYCRVSLSQRKAVRTFSPAEALRFVQHRCNISLRAFAALLATSKEGHLCHSTATVPDHADQTGAFFIECRTGKNADWKWQVEKLVALVCCAVSLATKPFTPIPTPIVFSTERTWCVCEVAVLHGEQKSARRCRHSYSDEVPFCNDPCYFVLLSVLQLPQLAWLFELHCSFSENSKSDSTLVVYRQIGLLKLTGCYSFRCFHHASSARHAFQRSG